MAQKVFCCRKKERSKFHSLIKFNLLSIVLIFASHGIKYIFILLYHRPNVVHCLTASTLYRCHLDTFDCWRFKCRRATLNKNYLFLSKQNFIFPHQFQRKWTLICHSFNPIWSKFQFIFGWKQCLCDNFCTAIISFCFLVFFGKRKDNLGKRAKHMIEILQGTSFPLHTPRLTS